MYLIRYKVIAIISPLFIQPLIVVSNHPFTYAYIWCLLNAFISAWVAGMAVYLYTGKRKNRTETDAYPSCRKGLVIIISCTRQRVVGVIKASNFISIATQHFIDKVCFHAARSFTTETTGKNCFSSTCLQQHTITLSASPLPIRLPAARLHRPAVNRMVQKRFHKPVKQTGTGDHLSDPLTAAGFRWQVAVLL